MKKLVAILAVGAAAIWLSGAVQAATYVENLTDDVYTNQSSPTANESARTAMYVENPNGSYLSEYGWWKFDTSAVAASLPSGSQIADVQFVFDAYSVTSPGGNVQVGYNPNSSLWTQSTITWNNQPTTPPSPQPTGY